MRGAHTRTRVAPHPPRAGAARRTGSESDPGSRMPALPRAAPGRGRAGRSTSREKNAPDAPDAPAGSAFRTAGVHRPRRPPPPRRAEGSGKPASRGPETGPDGRTAARSGPADAP
ncbi:hypothetical protein GCM10009564_08630 [Streptomyces thermogriseus]|uniref:Uncharacterized protein n=1 Tax=Streptomyces thermogriseus TaxID=75292 RepID=A0ABN1SU01_9ACTN